MNNLESVKVIISACLIGLRTNYKGKSVSSPTFEETLSFLAATAAAGIVLIPVCPEQLGGMPTPRDPSELTGTASQIFTNQASVVSINGADVTARFLRGAEETLKIAELLSAKVAILKQNSPSCGSKNVYSGDFSSTLVPGKGITTFLLEENGVLVLDETLIKHSSVSPQALYSIIRALQQAQ